MMPDTVTAGRFAMAAPGIFIGDVYDPQACQRIMSEFTDADNWRQAQITTYIDTGEERGSLKSILDLDRRLAKRVHFSEVDMSVRPNASAYLDWVRRDVHALLRDEFGLVTDEFGEAEIIHYPQGGMFAPHADANKVKPYRAATVILYLNGEFEGGKTSFPELGFACTPKPGRVLVFPSEMLHSGEPVTSGEKCIITLWAFYPGGR